MLKSFIVEFILSSIIMIFEQKATVTELTLSIEDMSHAPVMPFKTRGAISMPNSSEILLKLST